MSDHQVYEWKEPFFERGWLRFAFDEDVLAWVRSAVPFAQRAALDPEQRRHWLRCGGTWFVGVNALPNDPDGRLPDGPGLTGPFREFITRELGWRGLDRGQVSITYPGYPKQDPAESDAAFRYRLNRAAAHVDGIKADLPDRRRCVGEAHAYVLGIPLNSAPENASPLVVWEGSHRIMQRAFQAALSEAQPEGLHRHDITEAYQAARAEVFETCRKITVHARPGESYLLHRFTLHGVAPWPPQGHGPTEGRMIAYFRPEMSGGVTEWLRAP